MNPSANWTGSACAASPSMSPDVVPALGGADDATVLSDHDMILLTLRF